MIQAVKDKIIVEIIKEEVKTDGGLFLPEDSSANAPQSIGKVLSIGDEAVEATGIQEGDTIAFAKFGGQDIIINKKVLKVLMAGEVYGIIIIM